MKRYLIAVALLATPHLLPAQESKPAQGAKPAKEAKPAPDQKPVQPPTFGAQVELVTVDVVVADKKQGTAITGLKQEDFEVYEDDKRQDLVSFEAISAPPPKPAASPAPEASPAPPPQKPRVSTNAAPELRTGRSFVIVFDDVHLTGPQARQAKIAVSEFLKTGVREGDRVTLISTGGDAWWTARMEAGREEMLALLKRLSGRLIPDRGNDRISEYEAMRIHVYADPQVMQRVQSRFQTYGVSPSSGAGRDTGGSLGGDPMVRGRASEVYFQSVSRNRLTLEVVERVLDSLSPVRGRKSLVLVSQGFIYDPNLDDFKRVVQASRRSNCAIYFLDSRGLTGFPDYFSAEFGPPIDDRDVGFAFFDQQQEAEGAESLASDSGGFTVRNTNDLSKGIQRIADETSSYYLLGYHPSNASRDGRFRKIRVAVKQKGVAVRARKGYFAPLEGGSGLEKKKTATGADPDIQTALDSPYEREEVPLRMGAFVLDETLLGKAKVMVAAEVDVRDFAFEQKEGRAVDALEFLMVAAHRETGEYFRYDQQVAMKLLPETRERLTKTWFPLMREFDLPPGGYQAKLVVRDKNSGRVGTVVHEFEVPELAGLRVSTPVLSDTLIGDVEKDPRSARPALTVRRTFPAGGMLYCQFEVYGAATDKASGMPSVSAGYVVRRLSDGVELKRVDPTPIKPTSLGKLSRMIGASLETATPGDYELVLQLEDQLAGKKIESQEPFTVEGAS